MTRTHHDIDADVRSSAAVAPLVVPVPDAADPEVVLPDVPATGGRDVGGLPAPKDQPSTLPVGGSYEPAPMLP